MTLMIELAPSEERRLAETAAQQGVKTEELAHRLIVENLPLASPPQAVVNTTLSLFEQWAREDAQLTPEELERELLEHEQFKANINAERERAGARQLF